MIRPARIFCIYCRGELTNDREISLQYHITCKNEFKIGVSDFESFDPYIVETFSNEVSLSRKMSFKESIILIVLMFSSFYLLVLNFILSMVSLILFLTIIFRIAHNWGKIDRILNFCDIVKQINPQYIYLSKNNCLALLGEVYIVNNPKKFDLFEGIYIIKFLNSVTVDSNKNKYPEAPLGKAFNDRVCSIQLATSIDECQIRYNSKRALKGLAKIYYVRNSDLQYNLPDLNQIIKSLNNETTDIKRKTDH